MSDNDADFRYMALNDLMAELSKVTFVLDPHSETRLMHSVLKLLKDNNGGVQNMTIRCLPSLMAKLSEPSIIHVANHLTELIVSEKEEPGVRDLAGIGMKTLVGELPAYSEKCMHVGHEVIPKLLQRLLLVRAF
jgi:cullin-associated NEDD8-dissociated protein 1